LRERLSQREKSWRGAAEREKQQREEIKTKRHGREEVRQVHVATSVAQNHCGPGRGGVAYPVWIV